MSLLLKLLWTVYRFAERLLRDTGLRKHTWGKKIVAGLNRAGSLLTAIFFRIAGPQIAVHEQRMNVADRRSAGFAFTISMAAGRYEPGTTAIFKRTLRPGSMVVDVGAHIGYYTLLASKLVGPGGRVYAFEPDPENYALLRTNVDQNGIRNVVTVGKAIAGHSGKVRLFRDARANDRHSLCPPTTHIEAGQSLEVEATSLDDFLQTQGWPRIDLIKLDVEGAEPIALEGMRRTLAENAGCKLVLEFGPLGLEANGISPRGFLEELVELGFGISSIEENGVDAPLSPADFPAFIAALKSRGAVNLLCQKAEIASLGPPPPTLAATRSFPLGEAAKISSAS